MIYAEWNQNGAFQNGFFESWADYHAATFSPDIEILTICVAGR